MRSTIQRKVRAAALALIVLTPAAAVLAPASAAAIPPPPPGDEHGPVAPYVVGGRDATENYSFAVSLQLPQADGSLRHFCTGSLISRQWVITAAHCTPDRIVPGVTRLRIGSTDRTSGGTLVGVRQVFVKQDYDPDKPGNDLALIRLEQAVPHRPVLIASRSGKVGSPNRVMGWGVTCDADLINDPICKQSPKILQELDTKRLLDARCSFFDRTKEVCIGSRDDQPKQACFGDSGGPLVRQIAGRWMLVGATTGDGDDSQMRPHVCTTAPPTKPGEVKPGAGIWQDLTIPEYRSWIAQTIWNLDRHDGEEILAQFREADALLATVS